MTEISSNNVQQQQSQQHPDVNGTTTLVIPMQQQQQQQQSILTTATTESTTMMMMMDSLTIKPTSNNDSQTHDSTETEDVVTATTTTTTTTTTTSDETNNTNRTVVSEKETVTTTIKSSGTSSTAIEAAMTHSRSATTGNVIPDPTSIPMSIVRCYRIISNTNHNSETKKYDIDTNVTVQLFHERMIVTCCQMKNGMIGTWLLCQPSRMNSNMHTLKRNNKSIQWEVSHLLGSGNNSNRNDPLLTVYCQRISTLVWERINNNNNNNQDPQTLQSQQQLPSKTILFGWTLWHPNPHGGAITGNSNSNNKSHEPELFHATVDVVVNTIVEAIGLSSKSW